MKQPVDLLKLAQELRELHHHVGFMQGTTHPVIQQAANELERASRAHSADALLESLDKKISEVEERMGYAVDRLREVRKEALTAIRKSKETTDG